MKMVKTILLALALILLIISCSPGNGRIIKRGPCSCDPQDPFYLPPYTSFDFSSEESQQQFLANKSRNQIYKYTVRANITKRLKNSASHQQIEFEQYKTTSEIRTFLYTLYPGQEIQLSCTKYIVKDLLDGKDTTGNQWIKYKYKIVGAIKGSDNFFYNKRNL